MKNTGNRGGGLDSNLIHSGNPWGEHTKGIGMDAIQSRHRKKPPKPKRQHRTPKNDRESAVLKEGMQWLEHYGLFVWRSNTGAVQFTDGRFMRFGFTGSADITGILPDGRRLECEAKRRKGGKQSDDQKTFQELIEANGGVYVLFHSAKELAEKLTPVLQQTGVLIPLTRGYSTRVDWDDWADLSQHNWCASPERNTWNAVRGVGPRTNRETVRLHRALLGLKLGDPQTVDHINRNGLDNRQCNLRILTNQENCMNSLPRSGYKGVTAQRGSAKNPWMATIMVDGKAQYLGSFVTAKDAARAYDKRAFTLYGDIAYLNFPGEIHRE